MDKEFIIIAITPPFFFDGEAERISGILSKGEADFVHIRKPEASLSQIENLIKGIDPVFHNRLKLHDHFKLIENYDLGGIHLNSRNKEIYPGACSVSKSYHSINEILEDERNYDVNKQRLDYFFISPVFDSISKKGYKANINLDSLADCIKDKPAIALGGVTPDKFGYLSSLGFKGAAMLGHFFPSETVNKSIN